ncbi:TetR/AcrR family transcriptional regulator [Marinactinospora thermotolerans]|uniref:Transcriptional regulator, TetR family n=1 Tax=Marinactinospora thermotolerans DSM 45154 TaxID=1122192 RepID=A0A1T4QHX2_9ACTN|nr:TetR/AcrR family transcriptional regulator [Marinactinospora thermotolerans]SKA02868.1 transcriptional regulator, TetR family [Marinactinospora thermotolerans DSM 45154]
MEDENTPGTRRPGGRTARTRAVVVAATLAELGEYGYGGLTVEGVARRCGVHKTTLYRRWGGVDGLLCDALDAANDDTWLPADTGTIDGDLREIAREVVRGFTGPQAPVPSAVIAAAFQSERAAAALRGFFAVRHRRCAVAVARAVERGELPADVDAVDLVRTAVAPLYYRLFVSREPVGLDDADRAAATALAAVRATAHRG